MKIVVTYKWAANPVDATVSADGSVDWSRAKNTVSEYDPVAIEVGRQLADATGGELIGVTVGTSEAASPMARKAALSRGLDRLVIAADDSLAELGTTSTAARLAEIINGIGSVDLVLTGDASVDMAAKMVPSTLAGTLGWPCLTDVSRVSVEGSLLTIERDMAAGSEVIEVQGPAVLACSSAAVLPRIPGMKDILAAGKKPSETVDVAAQRVPPETVEVTERRKPALRARKGHIFQDTDPNVVATELAQALRNSGIL